MSNIINEKLFEQIFGHTLIKLANKVINTKNKNKNIDKLHEMDDDDEWVDLYEAANLIFNFNERY